MGRFIACFALLLTFAFSGAVSADTKTPTAEDPKFAPLLSVGGGIDRERTELAVSEYTDISDRPLWTMFLDAGLRYPLPSRFLPAGRLIGRSFVGAAFVFRPGDWPLRLLQEFVWDFPVRRWFGLFFGLGFGANLNITRISRSYINFSIPLGLRLGWVEAAFSAGYNVSVSKEQKSVYDGTMTQRAATDFAPIYFYLRLHLPVLGW